MSGLTSFGTLDRVRVIASRACQAYGVRLAEATIQATHDAIEIVIHDPATNQYAAVWIDAEALHTLNATALTGFIEYEIRRLVGQFPLNKGGGVAQPEDVRVRDEPPEWGPYGL